MLTTYAGQTGLRTVMPGAIRSSMRFKSLKKTEDTRKKTMEASGILPPVDTDDDPDIYIYIYALYIICIHSLVYIVLKIFSK